MSYFSDTEITVLETESRACYTLSALKQSINYPEIQLRAKSIHKCTRGLGFSATQSTRPEQFVAQSSLQCHEYAQTWLHSNLVRVYDYA